MIDIFREAFVQFYKDLFTWKSDLKRERETDRSNEKHPLSSGLLPKRMQWPGLGQAEAREQEFPLGLPHECSGQSSSATFIGTLAGSWVVSRAVGN